MRRTAFMLAYLILALASCTSVSRPGSVPARADGVNRLLLVDVSGKPPGSLRIRPVDPATLADLPGFVPLDFGHHDTRAISPDDRILAAFVWPSGSSNSGGTLHLIDLVRWTDSAPGITVDDYVGDLTFGPAGRSLFWTIPTTRDSEHNLPWDFVLQRYDVGSPAPSLVVRLPPSFVPAWQGLRPLADGRHLAIYCIPTDANNLAEDAPHVLIVDLAARQIVADLRLAGVKAGQVQVNDSGDTERTYRIFRPGLAWDLARNRLYVVDAGDDWITVVDLAERRILERAKMHLRSSILDRIGRWLASPAEAKAVPSTIRTAELSLDGKRLYVIGTEEGDSLNTMGLQVVDTRDLTVIRRLDVPATDVALSPDGRRLVLHLWWPASAGTPERQGVFTFDTDGPSERGHAYLGSPYFLFGVSPNSRYAYISDPVRTGQAVVTRLQVLDLKSSRVVAERTVDGGYADLFPVRRSANDN